MYKRLFAILLVVSMLAAMMVGLGGCKKEDGGATHFSIFISQGESSEYYGLDYSQNPVAQYLQSKTWNVDGQDVQLTFEWEVPANGETSNYLANAFATLSYPDVIDVSGATSIMSVRSMYEDDYILDLTDYVEKYMPNYLAFLEANPHLAQTASTLMEDGSRKHLQIWAYQGETETMWGGWLYRRDWIVKYGTNPSTGAAFTTQGFTETTSAGVKDNYVDDVMFPSWYGLDAKGNAMTGPGGEDFRTWFLREVDADWDGSAPVTISDWEWMLEIFQRALAGEGISDGYAMGMYYPGYYEVGDLVSAFGVGPTWYLSDNQTEANFGLTTDAFRQYLIVMNGWYKNGWINQKFNESNKIFYEADLTEASQGKVGLWWGQNSQIGALIQSTKTEYVEDACVYGARPPMNTTYGTDEMKYNIPEMMYQTTQEMRSFVITDKTAEKDIAAFLTMMDYMYTEEGAVLQGYGLTDEMYAEFKETTGKTIDIMEHFKDENGSVLTWIEGDGWKYSDKVTMDSQEDALRGSRLWGYCPRWELHTKEFYPKTTLKTQQEWIAYPLTASISNSLLAQLDQENGDAFSDMKAQLRSFGEQNVYKFVKGENNPNDDTAWLVFCTRVKALKPEEGTQIIRDLLAKLN